MYNRRKYVSFLFNSPGWNWEATALLIAIPTPSIIARMIPPVCRRAGGREQEGEEGRGGREREELFHLGHLNKLTNLIQLNQEQLGVHFLP